MTDILQQWTSEKNKIFDPYCGSGSVIIACAMTNRVAIGIELIPNYVDVAVQRWQAYAKSEATLSGDGRTFAEIAKERAKAGGRRGRARQNGKAATSAPAKPKRTTGRAKAKKRHPASVPSVAQADA